MERTYQFNDGDLVQTRDGSVEGRIIGHYNPTPSISHNHDFYIILLSKPVENYPWSSILLSGVMLERLTVLDEIVKDDCAWCSARSKTGD